MKPKKIGITGLKTNPLAVKTAEIAIGILHRKKIRLELDSQFLKKGKPLEKFNCDFVFSFGGDGTMLRTFRDLKKQVPVMGINCGNKGFLHAYQSDGIADAVEAVLGGKYSTERRARITPRADGKKLDSALNEVLIVPQKPGRILKYSLKISGHSRDEAGDGLIVATPTGSTAHALSAGGPIVKGNADVFVIVSINPVDWKNRPLIINGHEKIIVSEFGKGKTELIIDGQKRFPVKKKALLEKGKDVVLATK